MITHESLVHNLCKSGENILGEMTPGKAHLLHVALGIAGEAGELADAVKKHAIYDQPIDLDNVIEELGDLEFYLQALRESLKLGREETLANNVTKLLKRYPLGRYRDGDAKARADKGGVQ